MDRSIFRTMLVPTGLEFIIYFAISVVFLLASQLTTFIDALDGSTTDTEADQQLFVAFGDKLQEFGNLLSQVEYSAPIILALFWSGVGVVVYLIVNIFQRFWLDTENDILIESQFIHPRHYKHSYFWALLVGRVVFRASMLIIIGVYMLFGLQVLMPVWFQLVEVWINNLTNPVNIISALFAVIGVMVSMHLMVIFSRLLFMRARIFS